MRRKNRYIEGALEFIQESFVALLITFILLILIDTIWAESVSRYINLNHLLISIIVLGAFAILTRPGKVKRADKEEAERRPTKRAIITMACVGLAGAAILWYKTEDIGWLSYIISLVGGGVVALMYLLIWREGDERKDSQDN